MFNCGWSYCILHRHNCFQAIHSQTSCEANDSTSSLIQWSLASQRTCLWCHVHSASKKGMIIKFMSLKYKVGLCICPCFHTYYTKVNLQITVMANLERKEIQEYKCCTYGFIYKIIFCFISGIYKHFWKQQFL
jgi:hypothetical protein